MEWMFHVESIEEIKEDCPNHARAGSIDKMAERLDEVIKELAQEQGQSFMSRV